MEFARVEKKLSKLPVLVNDDKEAKSSYCRVQDRRESKRCLKGIANKHALVYTFDLRCSCLK